MDFSIEHIKTSFRDDYRMTCETYIRRASLVASLLRGKWTLQILCAMRTEPVRLSRLTRLLPRASKKALRSGLRDLELANIVVRHDLSDTVLHVEYDFAEEMKQTVCDLLDHLAQWGELIEDNERTHAK
jgi:DNA-binding HxlR family transcriptional regulator